MDNDYRKHLIINQIPPPLFVRSEDRPDFNYHRVRDNNEGYVMNNDTESWSNYIKRSIRFFLCMG